MDTLGQEVMIIPGYPDCTEVEEVVDCLVACGVEEVADIRVQVAPTMATFIPCPLITQATCQAPCQAHGDTTATHPWLEFSILLFQWLQRQQFTGLRCFSARAG